MLTPSASDGARSVAIVKWDRLCADTLKRYAERACSCSAAVYHTVTSAVQTLRAAPCAFVITGMTFPDVDGIDFVRIAFDQKLARRILVVSGRQDEHLKHMLKSSPITGYYDSNFEAIYNLENAIRTVYDGGTYFSPTFQQRVPVMKGRVVLAQLLTSAEMQVFAIIGDGSDDEQAAERLGIKAATAHCHRQRIMRKLGVQTRVELMRTAIQRGVVRITPDRVFRPGCEPQVDGTRNNPLRGKPSAVT